VVPGSQSEIIVILLFVVDEESTIIGIAVIVGVGFAAIVVIVVLVYCWKLKKNSTDPNRSSYTMFSLKISYNVAA